MPADPPLKVESIVTWLVELEADPHERVVSVAVGVCSGGNQGTIDSGHVDAELEGEARTKRFQALAIRMWEASERDINSQTEGRPQQYAVVAYRGQEDVIARFPFTRTPARETAAFQTEPATPAGHSAQMMRHLEVRERVQMNGYETLITLTQGVSERLSNRCIELETALDAKTKMYADLETRLRTEVESKKSEERFFKLIQQVVPAIITKYVPELYTSPMQELKALFESLTPKQYQTIMETLDEGQRARTLGVLRLLASQEEVPTLTAGTGAPS